MKFTHLNRHRLYRIEARLALGQRKVVLARALSLHHLTIYRDCQRAGAGEHYCLCRERASTGSEASRRQCGQAPDPARGAMDAGGPLSASGVVARTD